MKSKGSQPATTSLFWRERSDSNASRVEWTPKPSDLCGSAATDRRLRRGKELVDGQLDLALLREGNGVAAQEPPDEEFELALGGRELGRT